MEFDEGGGEMKAIRKNQLGTQQVRFQFLSFDVAPFEIFTFRSYVL